MRTSTITSCTLCLLPSPASQSGDSTEAMTDWSECEAISELQAQLLIDWGLEGKVLHKRSEENEQLRPGQLFSQAGSLSCGTKTEDLLLSQRSLAAPRTNISSTSFKS